MIDVTRVPDRIGRLIVLPKAYARPKSLLAGFRWLRAHRPLARVEAEGFDAFWAVTRHADILEVLRQHDLFHNGDRPHTLVPRASDEMARSLTGSSHPIRTLVHMHAPDHLKYRRIAQSWFTPQRAKLLEDRIRGIARAGIDRMAEQGSPCDFVRDVAIHFPLHVLMQILGVPVEDEPRMLKLTQELFAGEDEDFGHSGDVGSDAARHTRRLLRLLDQFRAYFVPLMESRRDHAEDDLASVIANASVDGEPINHFE